MSKETKRGAIEHSRALNVLPCDGKDGVEQLEAAAQYWITTSNAEKWPHCIGWFSNQAYLENNHFTKFSLGNTAYGNAGPDSFQVRPVAQVHKKYTAVLTQTVDNRLKKPHEKNISILTKADPVPTVTPNSNAVEDIHASRLAELAFRVIWEEPLQMNRKIREVASLLSVFGTAVVEVAYEEGDVPVIAPQFVLEEIEDAEQEGIFGEKPVQMVQRGEKVTWKHQIQSRVYSPFHILVNPNADHDPESLLWIMRRSLEDIEWVKENFGEKPEEAAEGEQYFPENAANISGAPEWTDPLFWYERLRGILDSPERLEGVTDPEARLHRWANNHQTIVSVLDCKPTKQFPRGRTMVFAGTKILYCGPARAWSEKYPERWHPYTVFRFWKSLGRFWGTALLSMLVPLQKRINAIDGMTRIYRHFLTFGQYLIPENAMSRQDALDITPGRNIVYRGTLPPSRMDNAPFPSELFDEKAMLVQAIEGASLLQELFNSQGNTSNIRSGVMIDLMNKMQLESRSSLLMDFQDSIQHIAQNILIEINLHLEEEDPELTRRIQIAAREFSTFAVESFTNMDLRDNIHVKVDIMSSVFSSPEAQQQKALEYAQAMGGAQNMSPQEKAKIWDIMGFEQFENPEKKEVERAQLMLARIIEGRLDLVVPDPWLDDPRIFAEIFRDAMREERFYQYSGDAQQAIGRLAYFYRDLADQEQAQQMELQLKLQGMGVSPKGA